MNKKPLLAVVVAVLFAAAYLFERIPATDAPSTATPAASSQAAATLQRAFDEMRLAAAARGPAYGPCTRDHTLRG